VHFRTARLFKEQFDKKDDAYAGTTFSDGKLNGKPFRKNTGVRAMPRFTVTVDLVRGSVDRAVRPGVAALMKVLATTRVAKLGMAVAHDV